ncbi:histidine ammonia-lyase [Bacillus anthracis]|uniref:histidine ammonia-lyase n=1 Tax=Bacillus anthracis TaxID=1392 RepID=UPI003D2492DA
MITLTGHTLTIEEMKRLLLEGEGVTACPTSMQKVAECREVVEKIVEDGKVVYGITTGFGKFSDVLIQKDDVKALQHNLIQSHACGIGDPFPEEVSRGMLILRANTMLKGVSGVRPLVVNMLLEFVNRKIHPVVPQQGSLGASGDLAPLSHLALVLLGEGEVFYKGKRVHAMVALTEEGLEPIELEAKEGLALINGTQAMTIEGLQGIIDAFDENVHKARGYKEQVEVASRIRDILHDSKLTTKQGELRVQDAYSLRCIPQVHGASWQVLNYVKEKLEIEMNAATDNPLIFDGGEKVISGGNFHGQPIAFAMDFLKVGMAELANISERRIERLVNPQLNDLPPFLSPEPGLQSGAMIMQYAAASLVSENKTLAHPASVDSIPSSANQEDHVSMGTIASRHAHQIIQNVRRVLSIEMICAMQAAEYRGIENMSTVTKSFYHQGRQQVPSITNDRIFSTDIENITHWLKTNYSIKERLDVNAAL